MLFLPFWVLSEFPLGTSWGALAAKNKCFRCLYEVSQKGTTLVSFLTTLRGFGEHVGRIWEDLVRIWGLFWEAFGVVAGSLQKPWQTPLPAKLHHKTFAALHHLGTGRNVASAT